MFGSSGKGRPPHGGAPTAVGASCPGPRTLRCLRYAAFHGIDVSCRSALQTVLQHPATAVNNRRRASVCGPTLHPQHAAGRASPAPASRTAVYPSGSLDPGLDRSGPGLDLTDGSARPQAPTSASRSGYSPMLQRDEIGRARGPRLAPSTSHTGRAGRCIPMRALVSHLFRATATDHSQRAFGVWMQYPVIVNHEGHYVRV